MSMDIGRFPPVPIIDHPMFIEMDKESVLFKGCRRHAGTCVVLAAWCDIASGGSVGRKHCRYRSSPPRDRERGVADADAAGAETVRADRGGGLRQIQNLQVTNSFKDRGALVKLASLSEAERK